jgi:hypothetical protein
MKASLVLFHKRFGGKLGDTIFGGPTLYFDRQEFNRISKALRRYPDLTLEWRASYTSIAVF